MVLADVRVQWDVNGRLTVPHVFKCPAEMSFVQFGFDEPFPGSLVRNSWSLADYLRCDSKLSAARVSDAVRHFFAGKGALKSSHKVCIKSVIRGDFCCVVWNLSICDETTGLPTTADASIALLFDIIESQTAKKPFTIPHWVIAVPLKS